jgi:hypothetical protein
MQEGNPPRGPHRGSKAGESPAHRPRFARALPLGKSLAALGLLLVASGIALASSNTIASSALGTSSQAITPTALEPAFCRANGINPTTLITGQGGTVKGASGPDLLIGSGGIAQNLVGNGGNDCILAGSVPAGKTTTLNPAVGSVSACIKGPGPGTYTYGAGCVYRG